MTIAIYNNIKSNTTCPVNQSPHSIGCIICMSLKISRNQHSIGCTCESIKQGVILLDVNTSP